MLLPLGAKAETPVVMLPDFSALVTQVSPAVVNISTTKKVRVSDRQELVALFFWKP